MVDHNTGPGNRGGRRRIKRISFRNTRYPGPYGSRGAYPRFGARPDFPIPESKVRWGMMRRADLSFQRRISDVAQRVLFALRARWEGTSVAAHPVSHGGTARAPSAPPRALCFYGTTTLTPSLLVISRAQATSIVATNIHITVPFVTVPSSMC